MKPASFPFCLLLLLQICCPAIVFSQTGKVTESKFIVVDSVSASPLPGVTVYVFSKNQNKIISTAVTNDNGFCFVDDKILADTGTVISFSVVGYKEHQISGGSLKNLNFPIKVFLVSNSKTLEEVKVTSRQTEVIINGNTMEFDVNSVPNVKQMTTSDVLDYLPFIRVEDEVIKMMNDGVVILINGKPHPFYNTLKNLNSLPPAAIEQIIVELAPSSNYGLRLMNIILKKNYFLGWNGNFNTGVSRLGIGSAGSISYWQNKFGVDVSGNFNVLARKISINSSNETFTSKSSILQKGIRKLNGINGSLFTSIFFNFDSLNAIDFQYTYAPQLNTFHTTNDIVINTPSKTNFQTSFQDRENESKTTSYNLNYTRNFRKQGKQFYILSQYSTSEGEESYNLSLRMPDSLLRHVLYNNITSLSSSTFETGFRNRIKDKIKYRSGGKIIYRNNTNAPSLSEFVFPASFSAFFKYRQLVASGYTEADVTIKKFVTRLGLRFDHEDFSYRQPVSIKRTFNGLFPNLSVSYNLNKQNVIIAGYSRSVSRPSLQSLVPFPAAQNAYMSDSGSAQLKPQYGNSYNFQFYGNYKFGRLGVDAYYSSIKGSFDEYYVSSSDGNITRTYLNAKYYRSYSIGISAEIHISKKIRFSHYSSGTFNVQKGPNISWNVFTGYLSDRLNFNIDQKQRLSLSAIAVSPNITLQGKNQSRDYVHTTISYSYFTTLLKKYPISFTGALINPWLVNGLPSFREAKDVSFYYYERSWVQNPVINLQVVITFKGKQFLNKDSKRTESINNNDLK